MPADATTSGPERDDHAVRPGGARADRDERVHVGRAMPCRAPGRTVEAAAGPELDESRRQKDQPVELDQPDGRLRREHHDHDQGGDRDRRDRPDEERARFAIAFEVVRRQRLGERRRRVRRGGRAGTHVVAGRFDGADQSGSIGEARVVVDRGGLGGEVDRGLVDAGRLAQESLDPIDARRAGHPLDGEGHLGGGHRVTHTPWEYTIGGSVRHSPLCSKAARSAPRSPDRGVRSTLPSRAAASPRSSGGRPRMRSWRASDDASADRSWRRPMHDPTTPGSWSCAGP